MYNLHQEVTLGAGTFVHDDHKGEISLGGGKTVKAKRFPIKKDSWYRVTATVKGSRYLVKIGGQKIISYNDRFSRFNKEGTIGFIANGHIQIDDIKIKKEE